ncbi:hypothetical protein BT69DRAFT_1338599 [Atractiella rhizophila]|nr:hypothetical protein BT69DRAFT_1338599 [Atractiella rhizophila]
MRTRVVTSSLSRNQACLKCRSRKVRCSAERPGCDACRRSAGARGEDPSLVRCVYISPPPWGDKEEESEEEEPIVASGSPEDGDKNERYSFRKTRRNLADALRESLETASKPSSSKVKPTKPTKAKSVPKKTQKRKRKAKATDSDTDDNVDLDGEGDTDDDFTPPRSLQAVDSLATHSSATIASKPESYSPSAPFQLATPSRTAPSSDVFPSPLTSAAISPPSIQTTFPSHVYSTNEYSNVQEEAANKFQTVENPVEFSAPPMVHDYSTFSSPHIHFPDLHQAPSPTFSNFSGSAASEESILSVPSCGNMSLFHGNGSYPVTPGVDLHSHMQLQYLYLQQQQKLIHAPIAHSIDISPLPPAMSLPTPGPYLPPVTIQTTTNAYVPVSQAPNLSHIHALPPQPQYPLSVAPTPTFQTYVPVNYQVPIQASYGIQYAPYTIEQMEQLHRLGKNETLSPGLESDEQAFQHGFYHQQPDESYPFYPTHAGVAGLGIDLHGQGSYA